MSILETLKGRDAAATKSYVPAAPDIRRKLDALQARLGPLQAQLSELALEAELGNADAGRKFTSISEQVAEIKATTSKLNMAHAAAKARDEAAIVQQRASLARAQINSVRRHLAARDAAAEALAKSLKEATAHYQTVLDHSEKAERANPVGCGPWPAGAITSIGAIKPLVAAELYKLMPGDAMRSSSFPGAAPKIFDHLGKADAFDGIAETLKKDTNDIMEKLTGKAPGA